jgi:CubicO group peptidase (beta-lactamase class C family)
MKRFRFTRIILIIAAILGLAYALSPSYLRLAVFHQSPDVDDYKIFNNRVVASGSVQPWAEVPGYADREVPEAYRKSFKKLKTTAFLVIRDGKVQFEKYWHGYTRETLSNSFSVSKSVVSLLVGAALDNGALSSVNQPVGDFLPEFRNGPKAAITLRNLLEMSSGLSWDDHFRNNFSLMARAYYGDDLDSLVLSRDMDGEPGKLFDFEGINTQLLALVLEKATGVSLSTYASTKLWQPIGAGTDALWSIDRPNGVEKAFCCFNADARDLARLGQLILNRGYWNGRQLVSQHYLEQALTPDNHLHDGAGNPVDYYGWHWWLADYQGISVGYMGGVMGQYVIVVPEKNTVIVRLGKRWSKDRVKGLPSDLFTWIGAGLELSGN